MSAVRAVLTRHPWIAPLVSGIALVFAYEPFSIPVLPFVGLAPLFAYFSRPRSVRETVVGGLAFGIPYFVGNVYWLFYLTRFTVAGLGAGVGALGMHAASFVLVPVAMNAINHTLRAPLVLSAPAVWVVGEHARAQGDFIFPWVTLGYSLSDWPRLAQHADLIGVYGLSWWLAVINAVIVSLFVTRRGRRISTAYAAALVVLLAAPAVYGTLRWSRVERVMSQAPRAEIAVIQPNIPQRLKWDRSARDANLARLNVLIARAERLDPDLVVGPEASLPMIVSADDTRLPAEIAVGDRPLLLGVVRGLGRPVPVGEGPRRRMRYRRHLNSAFLAAPDRSRIGVHDKSYLVPVTEQIPYVRLFGIFLPFMREQFGRFVPADEIRVLTLDDTDPPVRFCALVCYESLFPDLIREMTSSGAELFVLVTNDAWFGRSTMPHQHLGHSVLRAIESRRAVVVSANTGISGFVDPLGRVTVRTPLFEEALVDEPVAVMSVTTPYMRWGAWVPVGFYGVVVVLLGMAWMRHARGRPR